MSAASSGHNLPYKIIQPKSSDLDGIKKGTRLLQNSDIDYVTNRAYEEWWVKKVNGDKIIISPLRGRKMNSSRAIDKNMLKTLCVGPYKVRIKNAGQPHGTTETFIS